MKLNPKYGSNEIARMLTRLDNRIEERVWQTETRLESFATSRLGRLLCILVILVVMVVYWAEITVVWDVLHQKTSVEQKVERHIIYVDGEPELVRKW